MENKTEWLSLTVGVAFTLIPFALNGLGMELPLYFYIIFLAIGSLCLLFAMHHIGGLAYGWVKERVKFQWPITIGPAIKPSEADGLASISTCPLTLIFTEISNVGWETQRHHIFKNDEIRVKNYHILIKNTSQSDVNNLEVEIEKAVYLKDRTTDSEYLPVSVHKKLSFEIDGHIGATRMPALPPGATAKLPFLSHSSAMLLNDSIQVKVKDDNVVYHMNHRWRFSTIITCSHMPEPITPSFLAWIDHSTGLLMVELESGY